MKSHNLTTSWQFKQLEPTQEPLASAEGTDGWLPASVPGSIHQDLIAAGRIPDPFFGTNENDVQWVGQADWLYRCTFDWPTDERDADQVDLCFDGLDTFATVWLNGESILTSDNMFVPARIPVKRLLKPSGNKLVIRFDSALRRGREVEAKRGPLLVWNGDTSRAYVRKAGYHYGWDWGPYLLTAGLWRPVRLEAYTARIADLSAPPEVSAGLQTATLPVQVSVEHASTGALLDLRLLDPKGKLVAEVSLPANTPNLQHTFTITKPELWYPHGYGSQAQYKLTATVRSGKTTLDARELRIGLRRLRLVQQPLANEPGETFYFEVNNIPLFCGGANWIPADSFIPRITPEQYRAWVQMAVDANMTMLRVWGGGIYEEDVFYDLCDELGVLVWQDFMFACGIYPAHDEFLASVRAEAESNVRRLRHHACIALWCGNNEDYQVAEAIKAYDPEFKGDFRQTKFPAREIYERLLPDICQKLDPTRPYWPGSPYGGPSVSDQTVGDRHTWDIWHGKMADYRDYPKFAGRFVSEFGMQAAPLQITLEGCSKPGDRDVYGAVMRNHNKANDGPERLKHYLQANTSEPSTLEDYVYLTQFIQSEALAAGIGGWRRRWAGDGRYAVAGALIWQLNDCWPVISWALADYYRRLKPAYYRVRRTLAPVALDMERTATGMAIWAVNATLAPIDADLDVQTITFDGSRIGQEMRSVTLPASRSRELVLYTGGLVPGKDVVVSARLIRGGEVIARAAKWPEPPKSAAYPDPGLQVAFRDERTLEINVQRPARGVYFSMANAPDTTWSDNMLDLIPGDPQVIQHRAGGAGTVAVRWYNTPMQPPSVLGGK